ncbi:hypothetical protein CHS0354_035519 [Potamilus streckersoni]|uniref:Cadherin domain-containing protein n=1 Tax=Potamilus streckersoni TaxID=2493646 RepID=A0AAE0RSQ9_9BIVA|nr:hypothetical protein CHS0354_035519 [Potamilus streckersoni]
MRDVGRKKIQLYLLVYTVTFLTTSRLICGSPPVIHDITLTVSVDENTETLTTIKTFSVSDPDGDSVSCNLAGGGSLFSLNSASAPSYAINVLSNSAGFNYDSTPSYTLTVTCTDINTESASASIQVNINPDQAPTITDPPSAVQISENTVALTPLYQLTVTDHEDDSMYCNLTEVNPESNSFAMWIDVAPDYRFYLLAGQSLNYETVPMYTLRFACSDSWGTSTSTLIVEITPNKYPVFSNLPDTATRSAISTDVGTSIFTVTATDLDNTALTYSIEASNPSSNIFDINSATGVVTNTQHLKYVLNSVYHLTIKVTDGKDSTNGTLTISLTNVNTAPTIQNLDSSVSVLETMASGSTIYSLVILEPNAADTVTTSYSVSPADKTSLFSFDPTTSKLILNGTLDYETQSSFTIEFTVTDGKASSGPYTLTITVIDENEACFFDRSTYFTSTYEASSGFGSMDPEFVVSDQDNGDTYTLSIQTSASSFSNYFKIDITSGIITFAVDYNVDQGAYPSNGNLIVICTDAGDAKGTATVSVSIYDANDSAPEFPQIAYVVYPSQYTQPSDTILYLAATDKDSGDNAKITYTWTAQTGGSTYYQLSATGRIYVAKYLSDLSYGQSYRFIVQAVDHGNPALTGTTTVDVIYRETTTTTTTSATNTTVTTTTKAPTFFDYPANIAMVVLMNLMALGLLSFLAYYLYKYCKTPGACKINCCKTPINKSVAPTNPNLKKISFDFWNETNDNNFKSKPFSGKRYSNETKVPMPAPVL